MIDKVHKIKYLQDLPWSEIKQKSYQYLPKAVFIIFVVLLVKNFADLTWKLFTNEQELVVVNKQAQIAKPQVSKISLKEVASYHLFGNAERRAPVQQKIIDAPETRLRLDLKGFLPQLIQTKPWPLFPVVKIKTRPIILAIRLRVVRSYMQFMPIG